MRVKIVAHTLAPEQIEAAKVVEHPSIEDAGEAIIRGVGRGNTGSHFVMDEAGGKTLGVMFPHERPNCFVFCVLNARVRTYKVLDFDLEGNDYVLMDDSILAHP